MRFIKEVNPGKSSKRMKKIRQQKERNQVRMGFKQRSVSAQLCRKTLGLNYTSGLFLVEGGNWALTLCTSGSLAQGMGQGKGVEDVSVRA